MGVRITTIGRGAPGVNGVPGDTFNNKELLEHLKSGLSLWQRMGLRISPSKQKEAERGIEVLEKKTGIKERQIFISDTLYPNQCLAAASGLNAFELQRKKDTKFDPKEIDGFIFVTDTEDTVFPASGKAVAKVLGITPKHYSNSSMACSSIANALWQAGSWFEFDPDCKKVLIIACDITTRLHQANTKVQPFLFGDQAVALIVEKTSSKGGFKLSNVLLNLNAPDIVHVPLYTGDPDTAHKNFTRSDFGNDKNLKSFGRYDARSIGEMFKYFLKHRGIESHEDENKNRNGNGNSINGFIRDLFSRLNFQRKGEIREDEKIILPQIGLNIIRNSAGYAGVNWEDFRENIAQNTVVNHGVTGAAGTPLAMFYMDQSTPVSDTYFTAILSAIGGINAMFTYDPNARKNMTLEYNLTPEMFQFEEETKSRDADSNPEIPVDVTVQTNNNHNGKKLGEPEPIAVNRIASAIKEVLQK